MGKTDKKTLKAITMGNPPPGPITHYGEPVLTEIEDTLIRDFMAMWRGVPGDDYRHPDYHFYTTVPPRFFEAVIKLLTYLRY